MAFFDQESQDGIAHWENMQERWLASMQRRRGSTQTPKKYQGNLRAFFVFIVWKHPAAVTGADCERYCAWMEEQHLSKSTINTRLSTISSFYRFAARYEVEPGRYLHAFNPALAVERYHIQPYEHAQQGLTVAQVKQLLAACDRTTAIGARDFAILLFYIYTARRRNELLGIRWADVREGKTPGTKEYRYRGKGGKGGWRTLPQPVWEAIKEYLQIAGRLDSLSEDCALFVPTNDHAARLGHHVHLEDIDRKPLNETTVNQIVKRAAARAGLQHVSVHTLRYPAAQLRRKSGDSIDEISDLLDHANSGITKLYLAAVEGKADPSWQNIAKLLDEQK